MIWKCWSMIQLCNGWIKLTLQLVEARSDCGPLEFFVPRVWKGVGVTDVVKVTYSNGLFGGNLTEASAIMGEFLQCCGWASPKSAILSVEDFEDGTRRTHSLSCSILPSHSTLDGNDSGDTPSLLDFCLRFNSSVSSSFVVANSERSDVKDLGCELKADAVISLFLYLKWYWLSPSRPSFLASVQSRGECLSVSCNLSISTRSWLSESVALRGGFFSGCLGTVKWFGALSSKGPALLSQEYEAALTPHKESNRSFEHFGMRPPEEKSITKMFDLSLSALSPMSTIQPLGSGLNQLGRRSLQARVVRGGDSRFQWSVYVTGTLVTLAGISMLAMLCAGKKEDESPTEFLDTLPILPPRFSYSKLQKATKNFSQKLGDGAFGSVYEGTLPNGTRVAVKMLEKTSVQGEKQFRAEVSSMGAIRHLNLVRLHGFCSEGSHRLLVYEFMPNGSLDSWLFCKKQGEKLLDWEQRLSIAAGTARALAYLHEECSDHIIHLDVKPENILLDHQFCPKLSDFGLAKLMDREQSRVVTSMRGTPGYLAPEWLLPHAAVTAKTDVYSFGMVLLELLSGRENTNFSLGKEQWYFPAWAFKLMSEGRTMELLDKRLHVEEVEYFHKQDAVRAIHVALLCIQDDPESRPAMSRVVHMLQGHVEPEPLNARQAAIQPPRRLVTAFAASVCDNESENGNTDKNDKVDSRKNSMSNDHLLKHDVLSDLQADMRNDHYAQRNDMNLQIHRPAVPAAFQSRLPAVSESPRASIKEAPPRLSPRMLSQLPTHMPPQQSLEDWEEDKDALMLESELPSTTQQASQYRSSKGNRVAGAHTLGSNPKCIPPWPVKGDVILLRGPQGDFHGVVRDVRAQTKMMRLGILHRLSSETRWSVREEESNWRHWNESIRTLDFWTVFRWATIPGRGLEKFPVEWQQVK
ncbi:uncharacterized protein [Physcomitrium patens]|uniref:non-specific serine/threonine protein kinase n=1 Tax=Physcomitrium patens TaxID=3218 RepID=A0A7I4AQE4_PHYPA|nr:uncharacterized protein LOC112291718 isoform X2 [Physcomitrium patens]|eukprot:XP_024395305.1 uncharacterized protein LOC112291718 isoform X2 [Physcomitrella patens]